MTTVENDNGYRTQAMYTFSEAARLAGVSAGTVRNWLFGYTRRESVNAPGGRVTQDRRVDPLFNTMPADAVMVSFLQLVEIVMAGKFRTSEGVRFEIVKRAYENAQQEFHIDHPFAHLELRALGGEIVRLMHKGSSQSMSNLLQWTLPDLVSEAVDQLDYEHDLASRWHPVGKGVPIVVDPKVSAGVPTFEGRGITISALYWRWKHERQPMDFIASDFELTRDQVEQVLRYAERVA